MTFYLALAAAVMAGLSLVLHAVGTKYPTAEKYAQDIDAVEKVIPKP